MGRRKRAIEQLTSWGWTLDVLIDLALEVLEAMVVLERRRRRLRR
jgi:hypothetical protein